MQRQQNVLRLEPQYSVQSAPERRFAGHHAGPGSFMSASQPHPAAMQDTFQVPQQYGRVNQFQRPSTSPLRFRSAFAKQQVARSQSPLGRLAQSTFSQPNPAVCSPSEDENMSQDSQVAMPLVSLSQDEQYTLTTAAIHSPNPKRGGLDTASMTAAKLLDQIGQMSSLEGQVKDVAQAIEEIKKTCNSFGGMQEGVQANAERLEKLETAVSQIACCAAEASRRNLAELTAVKEACNEILAAVKAMADQLVAQMTPAVAPGTNETNPVTPANGNAVAATAAGTPGSHNEDMQPARCAAVLQPAEQVHRSPSFQSGGSARAATGTGKRGRLTQYFQSRRQARTPAAADKRLNQSVPSHCAKDSPARVNGMQAADVRQTEEVAQVKAAKKTTPPDHQGIKTRSMAAKFTSPKDNPTQAAQQHAGRNRTGTVRAPSNADRVADNPVPGQWRRKHSTAPKDGMGIGDDADEGPRKTFSRKRNSSKQRLGMQTPKQQLHAASVAESGGSAPSHNLSGKAPDDAMGSGDGHISTNGSRAPDKVGERPLQLTLPRRTPGTLPPPSPSLHYGHPLAASTEEDAGYAAAFKHAAPSREPAQTVRGPLADKVSGAKQQAPEKRSSGTSKRQRGQAAKPGVASLDPFAALFARAADGNAGPSEDAEPPAIDEQEIKREVKRRMLIQRMRRGPS
ncbi:hypothetical protein COCOBI_08-2290 [Coccomyxa sp. Obi]|nr:hypothetical protein COCOBI_08-2290 [Coccomyxa sp. Obi]